MIITKSEFESFMAHARKLVPSFTVHDGKSHSYLMNVIDGIVYPFNKRFMKGFITTVFSDVYFPDGQIVANPTGAFEVAGHELVHAYDAKRLTFPLFAALYLSAISLFIVALVAIGLFVSWAAFLPFAALGVHGACTAITFKYRKITGFPLLILSLLAAIGLVTLFKGWAALWLVSAAILLAPLPAPGRAWAELRGYGMSIVLELRLFGRASIDSKVRQFTGPNYFWMMPFAAVIRRRLEKYEADARTGKLDDPVFLHVLEFLNKLTDSRVVTGELQ